MVAGCLAAAGCGGGGAPADAGGNGAGTATDLAAEATTALDAAEAAVGMVMDDSGDGAVAAADRKFGDAETAVMMVPVTERSTLSERLGELRALLRQRTTSRTKAMEAQRTARGKSMFGALRGPAPGAVVPLSNTALNNVEITPAFNLVNNVPVPDVLKVNAADGAGSASDDAPSRDLLFGKGEPGGTVNGWGFRDYTGSGDAKGNRARVYSSRTDPERKLAKDHFATDNPNRPSVRIGAYNEWTNTVELSTATYHGIQSPEFPTVGSKIFKDTLDPNLKVVKVRGTYAGAPGEYRCTPSPAGQVGERCGASFYNRNIRTGTEAGISLSTGWTFAHDEGAMVDVPDDSYYYFGWWVREDDEGMPVAASAFWNVNGITATSASVLHGSATYAGTAAGLYGINSSLLGVEDASDGGHFTADAELEAMFGGASDSGALSGTVDNFRLDGGGDTDPGWSVALEKRALAGTGIVKGTTESTVWTIDGKAAPKSGIWDADFYDQTRLTGGETKPTDIGGTFYTEFESTHRMVGAFGAELQE